MSGEVQWWVVPLGGVLLEWVDDLSVLAELADEAFLSTQTAAENVGTGELDDLGQEGSKFPVNHLEREEKEEYTFNNNNNTRFEPSSPIQNAKDRR